MQKVPYLNNIEMDEITIPVFSAFAGYDSQFLALRRFAKWFNKNSKGHFHLEFDLVGWCEIDKSAIKSHNALFPEYKDRHYPDIKTVPWHKLRFALLIYSSCCQDITGNGNQIGFTEGSGTRSALLWYVLPAIRQCCPLCCILENVPAILENKFSNEFRKWQEAVDNEKQMMCQDGPEYVSNWTTLSAADFGVPQNRNRCFMISFRKDINKQCVFPKPFGLKRHAESILEKNVDERYYLPVMETVKFIKQLCIDNKISEINVSKDGMPYGNYVKRILTPTCKNSDYHICPTLLAGNGDYSRVSYKNFYTMEYFPKPAILEVWRCSDSRLLSPYNLKTAHSSNDSVELPEGKRKKVIGISNGSKAEIIEAIINLKSNEYFRLRRLTPFECFSLMGVRKSDNKKLISSGVSEAQLYKQAGNSIVVDVIYNLYKSTFFDIIEWCNQF